VVYDLEADFVSHEAVTSVGDPQKLLARLHCELGHALLEHEGYETVGAELAG
jgi:hypothetical protein